MALRVLKTQSHTAYGTVGTTHFSDTPTSPAHGSRGHETKASWVSDIFYYKILCRQPAVGDETQRYDVITNSNAYSGYNSGTCCVSHLRAKYQEDVERKHKSILPTSY